MQTETVQSLNKNVSFNEKMDILFQELSERTEMSCSSNHCTIVSTTPGGGSCLGNISFCDVNL